MPDWFGRRCAQCERPLDEHVITVIEESPLLEDVLIETLLCGHGCLARWAQNLLAELDAEIES